MAAGATHVNADVAVPPTTKTKMKKTIMIMAALVALISSTIAQGETLAEARNNLAKIQMTEQLICSNPFMGIDERNAQLLRCYKAELNEMLTIRQLLLARKANKRH
jgi:hypothetical protein